jgi:hypothetical protein
VIRFRNRSHEVNGYSRTLPYVGTELKPVMPKIDVVLTSAAEFGGPATILDTYASRRSMGDNPTRTEGGVLADRLTMEKVLYPGVPTRTMLTAGPLARSSLVRRCTTSRKLTSGVDQARG